MFLNLLLVLFFVFSFWHGWKRGLLLQLLSLLSTVLAFVISAFVYRNLSENLSKFVTINLPKEVSKYLLNPSIIEQASAAFYAALVFVFLYFVIKGLLRLLTLLALPLFKPLSFGKLGRIFAAAIALVLTYINLQILLTMLSIAPAKEVQNLLASSSFAQWMITQTPLSSSYLLQLFIENIIHIKAL